MREAAMADVAVQADGLYKRFGQTHALRGIDLTVAAGTVCGLLGPNGAGKTTVVRILTTLAVPDAGRARVAGHDVVRHPDQVRSRIGLAGQHAAVDEKLTGRDNLRMFGRLYHLPPKQARRRADELLDRFDLTAAADRLVSTYSGGMRRRLDVITSLIVAPSVLLAEPAQLDRAAGILAVLTGSVPVTEPPDRISVPVAGGSVRLAEVVRRLELADVCAADVALRRPTLDEVFLRLTEAHPERQVDMNEPMSESMTTAARR